MNLKLTVIGFVVMIIGCVLANLSILIWIGAPLAFIGMIFFAGFYSEDSQIEYATIENEKYVFSIKVKKYYHFFPFTLIFSIFRTDLRIPYKTKYFKFIYSDIIENVILDDKVQITKNEYKNFVAKQKNEYLNKTASPEIVEIICSPEVVKLWKARVKYVICLVLAIICLTGLTVPADIPLALGLIAFFGMLTAIFYSPYKEAKFKIKIFKSYFNNK